MCDTWSSGANVPGAAGTPVVVGAISQDGAFLQKTSVRRSK